MREKRFSQQFPFARVVARFSAAALHSNYRAISSLVPEQSILPMIKANAYGHGATWVARQLLGLPKLYGFGVASFEEAGELRTSLGSRGRRTKIVVLSGVLPWSEEKGQYCERNGLTAVIATEQDWYGFFKGGWADRISYELKFNTGMNRLGIPMGLAPVIARSLRRQTAVSHPSGVLSHLAAPDEPSFRLSQLQREKFLALRAEFSSACPAAHFHLAASGGIWNQKVWGLKGLTDVVRPGISLYGVVPWDGAPERGLQPVMALQAGVVAVNRLKRGESTGYGGTFTGSGKEAVHVAILAGGYADGIHRSLSGIRTGQGNSAGGGGHVWLSGIASRFLGVVSMDMATVRATERTQIGEWAEIIGPHVDIWAQARAAGTIPYELLTSLSARVQRIYD